MRRTRGSLARRETRRAACLKARNDSARIGPSRAPCTPQGRTGAEDGLTGNESEQELLPVCASDAKLALAPGKGPVLFGKVPTWCGHVRPLVTYQTELQPSKSGHDVKDPLRPVPGYARMQKLRRLRRELRRGGDSSSSFDTIRRERRPESGFAGGRAVAKARHAGKPVWTVRQAGRDPHKFHKTARIRMELRLGWDCNLHGSAAHRVSWQRGTRHDYTPLDAQETVERVKQVDAHGEA